MYIYIYECILCGCKKYLIECRALLIKCRALWGECWALWGDYQDVDEHISAAEG